MLPYSPCRAFVRVRLRKGESSRTTQPSVRCVLKNDRINDLRVILCSRNVVNLRTVETIIDRRVMQTSRALRYSFFIRATESGKKILYVALGPHKRTRRSQESVCEPDGGKMPRALLPVVTGSFYGAAPKRRLAIKSNKLSVIIPSRALLLRSLLQTSLSFHLAPHQIYIARSC